MCVAVRRRALPIASFSNVVFRTQVWKADISAQDENDDNKITHEDVVRRDALP